MCVFARARVCVHRCVCVCVYAHRSLLLLSRSFLKSILTLLHSTDREGPPRLCRALYARVLHTRRRYRCLLPQQQQRGTHSEKVISKGTVSSTYTRALTCDNLCQGLALATPGLRSPIRDIRGRNSAVPITPHTPGMGLNFPHTPHTPASAYGRHFPQTPGGKSTRVGIGILMYARAHCVYYNTDNVLRILYYVHILLSTILRCT